MNFRRPLVLSARNILKGADLSSYTKLQRRAIEYIVLEILYFHSNHYKDLSEKVSKDVDKLTFYMLKEKQTVSLKIGYSDFAKCYIECYYLLTANPKNGVYILGANAFRKLFDGTLTFFGALDNEALLGEWEEHNIEWLKVYAREVLSHRDPRIADLYAAGILDAAVIQLALDNDVDPQILIHMR